MNKGDAIFLLTTTLASVVQLLLQFQSRPEQTLSLEEAGQLKASIALLKYPIFEDATKDINWAKVDSIIKGE